MTVRWTCAFLLFYKFLQVLHNNQECFMPEWTILTFTPSRQIAVELLLEVAW